MHVGCVCVCVCLCSLGVGFGLGSVTNLRAKDPDADKQLFIFGTGLHLGVRFNDGVRHKKVMDAMVDHRIHSMGERLSGFALEGAINNGMVNWGWGVYEPIFDAQHKSAKSNIGMGTRLM